MAVSEIRSCMFFKCKNQGLFVLTNITEPYCKRVMISIKQKNNMNNLNLILYLSLLITVMQIQITVRLHHHMIKIQIQKHMCIIYRNTYTLDCVLLVSNRLHLSSVYPFSLIHTPFQKFLILIKINFRGSNTSHPSKFPAITCPQCHGQI